MEHKVWYERGLRFSCTRCGNCCRNHGDYARVYLSERDVDAIAAFLDLDRARFLREQCDEEDGWILLRLGEPQNAPIVAAGGRGMAWIWVLLSHTLVPVTREIASGTSEMDEKIETRSQRSC